MALRKIFLVHAKKPVGYDEFSGFVIVEKNEEAVRNGLEAFFEERTGDQCAEQFDIAVLGTASKDVAAGIHLKSFQAG